MASKKKTFQAPKVAGELELILLDDELENGETYFRMGQIEEADINREITEKLSFDQVVFKNVSLESATLNHSEFLDVRFENCDLSNADFSDVSLHRVEFIQCKALGLNLAGATLGHVRFEQCLTNYATFSYSNCQQVLFQSCSLIEADYYSCTFENIHFKQCQLNKANFGETTLAGVDLSSSTFESLQISLDKLAGCTVSTEQAIAFSKGLGLIIKDESSP